MNKDAALRLVSIGGSVASIVALLIVLLQLVAERASVPAQYMVWRLLLAGIALVCAAGVAMFTFQYCQEVLQGQKPARAKTWRVFLSVGGVYPAENLNPGVTGGPVEADSAIGRGQLDEHRNRIAGLDGDGLRVGDLVELVAPVAVAIEQAPQEPMFVCRTVTYLCFETNEGSSGSAAINERTHQVNGREAPERCPDETEGIRWHEADSWSSQLGSNERDRGEYKRQESYGCG